MVIAPVGALAFLCKLHFLIDARHNFDAMESLALTLKSWSEICLHSASKSNHKWVLLEPE